MVDRSLAGLRRAADKVERPAYLGPLEIFHLQVEPARLEMADVDRYVELGVDHLVVYPLPLQDLDQVTAFLEHHAQFVQ